MPHNYGPAKGRTWDELYLVYSGPLFDLLSKRSLVSARQPICHPEPIAYWTERLCSVLDRGLSSLQQISRLFTVLADIDFQTGKAAEPAWRTQTTLLMEEGVLSTRSIARKLGMSYERFRKKFTEMEGESPERCRRRIAIRKAGLRLISSEASIKEIFADLGFCDAFHFAKSFKKVMGMSPTEFRNHAPRKRPGVP